MVTAVKRLGGIIAIAVVCLSTHARDISTSQIGDPAQADITATVPFDVVDTDGTEALKASRALNVPAVYRGCFFVTNAIARDFLAAFAQAHRNFSNAIGATFQTNVDNTTITSPDFGYFLTAFNVQNKNFPLTAELADTWAHGESGAALRDQWLGLLLKMMKQPVKPDALPDNFVVQKSVRILPVSGLNETVSATAVRRAQAVPVSDVVTISNLRAMFRQKFSEDDQPVALALSRFLQPNCFPDVALTREVRDDAVRQIVVAVHFDTGQIIVHRGETITAQTKAALDALDKQLIPGTLNQQIAAEQTRVLQEQQRAQQEQEQAQNEHAAAQLAQQQQQQAFLDRTQAEKQAEQEREQAAAMHEEALNAQNLALKIRTRDEWLVVALAAVSGTALLALLVFWLLMRRQRNVSSLAPAKLQRMEKSPGVVPAELAPFLAETLKEAVVQGLAAQRAELLEAQRMASAEIAELVHRLDQLQAPMQERLRTYQDRIVELQKELAQRTEENRELLRLKIEMMRRQIEMERERVNFN